MSPLDGRNDSRKAQGGPALPSGKTPRCRTRRWPQSGGLRPLRGDLRCCHQMEMPDRCLLSPPANVPSAARLPAPSPAFGSPAGRGEWYPGTGRDDASAVQQHRQCLENGEKKKKSHLDHLHPPSLVTTGGEALNNPPLYRVTCF